MPMIKFDNYLSSTDNDLSNYFNQTGGNLFNPTDTTTPYVQTPTGGVTGGAVVAYSGSEYSATAVYTPSGFHLSTPGASISLSIDVFYNAQFQPLAPGANAVRSFRLGLLDSSTSAFETFGEPSVYIEGDYSFTLQQMLIVARDQTNGPVISVALSQQSLSPNHWYQISATFANQGNNQIGYTGSLFDLGGDGNATPASLSTWNWSSENDQVSTANSLYAGFSALRDGGVALADNFGVPGVASHPPPPLGTTADMILRHSTDGLYEIYDIGNNAILAAYSLGHVGTEWTFVTLGGFFDGDTSDMLLRNSNTGGFEVYDISNNNITNAAFLGTVGLEWQVMGFGNFSSRGETDMMMRNPSTGDVEILDIKNNQVTGGTEDAFLGTWGPGWQFAGFNNHGAETDMILRNTSTGGIEVYDITYDFPARIVFLGTVGTEWQVVGFGDFSSLPGEGDMMMRNTNTGAFMVYDISNDQITSSSLLGTVGLEWQVAGFGPMNGAGTSAMVLRNVNNGAFEVYDIANNQITGAASLGQVGLDWQLGGFAADPPTASMSSDSTAQLVQAMAGFGGGSGAAESLNNGLLGADTQQQALLTTPQHA
jgi:hypothetical protein